MGSNGIKTYVIVVDHKLGLSANFLWVNLRNSYTSRIIYDVEIKFKLALCVFASLWKFQSETAVTQDCEH